MAMSKKRLTFIIAALSVLALLVTGIPFGDFSEVAFANLYGSSSSQSGGVSASIDSSCTLVLSDGTSIQLSAGVAVGTGSGGWSVVKNVVASEDPGYRVVQVNNADNTIAFEVWINAVTGGCAVRAL